MKNGCIRRAWQRTWVKIVVLTGGGLVLLALAVVGTFAWMFIPRVAPANFPAPANATEAYEQDLSYLLAYGKYEKAFQDAGKRAAFTEQIKKIRQDLAGMSPARFELAVAGAAALADNGHSNVSPIGRTRRLNHFPIRTGPFEDGEFVLQATLAQADLLGAELLEVEGHPIVEVVNAFLPYFGGVERRARFFSHLLIMSPALLHAQGFTESADGARLTLRRQDGEIVTRFLDGIPPRNAERQPFGRELMDYRTPKKDRETWRHLMDGKQPPLYLAEPDEPYLYRFLEDKDGAYVKINFNADVGERSLTGWLDGVMADLSVRRPRFAVVDLRFNGGGTDATADFAERLPSLVDNGGRIYILTSRETFSAALGAAAQFKLAAGDRARIAGGLVGDRLRFIGNGGELYELPNSGVTLSVWSTWEDYHDGCWDWTECFWLSPFFRKPGVDDLQPDLPVALNFRDYVLGRDAALEAVLADVAETRP
ncbi:MAG: S41 family peptidase [Gammaproteobacteria bacterium]|nr:S41 family peptidase [Gammaproteobacteria bacterium]